MWSRSWRTFLSQRRVQGISRPSALQRGFLDSQTSPAGTNSEKYSQSSASSRPAAESEIIGQDRPGSGLVAALARRLARRLRRNGFFGFPATSGDAPGAKLRHFASRVQPEHSRVVELTL